MARKKVAIVLSGGASMGAYIAGAVEEVVLAERLRERRDLHGAKGLVFGVTYFTTKAGQPRDRNNVSKALRRVFATPRR